MSLRLTAAIDVKPSVGIEVDGVPVCARAGESVAVALLAMGRRHLRNSPRNGSPRGFFCHMGACQECLVRVDGQWVPACQTHVREGLVIETGCSR